MGRDTGRMGAERRDWRQTHLVRYNTVRPHQGMNLLTLQEAIETSSRNREGGGNPVLQSKWTSNRLALENVDPGPLPPGRVRISVSACGICGSDLHYYAGRAETRHDVVLGHEIVGTVLDGPAGLADTLYAIEPLDACLDCNYCAAGATNICPNLKFIGIDVAGGLAESIDVPRHTVHPAPPTLPPLLASLTEPMACSYRGVRLANLKPESRVLVLGAGTIGLFAGLLARDRAAEVAITARHPQQVDAARRLGLTPLGESDWEPWARDRQPDVVIETVGGQADTINDAITAAQPEARIVIVGIFTGLSKVDGLALVVKEVDIVGSSMYGVGVHGREFASTIDALARYQSEVGFMLTHQYPLTSITQAFDTALDKKSGAIKVTVLPGGC